MTVRHRRTADRAARHHPFAECPPIRFCLVDVEFLEWDLGTTSCGSNVVVTLRGAESDVFLLTPRDLARFRSMQPFSFTGGHFQSSSVRLIVPQDDHWHLVVVPGPLGRVEASVRLVRAA